MFFAKSSADSSRMDSRRKLRNLTLRLEMKKAQRNSKVCFILPPFAVVSGPVLNVGMSPLSGTGIGQGEGRNDVSEQIENEEQVLGHEDFERQEDQQQGERQQEGEEGKVG